MATIAFVRRMKGSRDLEMCQGSEHMYGSRVSVLPRGARLNEAGLEQQVNGTVHVEEYLDGTSGRRPC